MSQLITQSLGGMTITVQQGSEVLMPSYQENTIAAVTAMAINFMNAGCDVVRIPFYVNPIIMGFTKDDIVISIKKQFLLYQNGRAFDFLIERKKRTENYIITVCFKKEGV